MYVGAQLSYTGSAQVASIFSIFQGFQGSKAQDSTYSNLGSRCGVIADRLSSISLISLTLTLEVLRMSTRDSETEKKYQLTHSMFQDDYWSTLQFSY